jgi:hypothetical protein
MPIKSFFFLLNSSLHHLHETREVREDVNRTLSLSYFPESMITFTLLSRSRIPTTRFSTSNTASKEIKLFFSFFFARSFQKTSAQSQYEI